MNETITEEWALKHDACETYPNLLPIPLLSLLDPNKVKEIPHAHRIWALVRVRPDLSVRFARRCAAAARRYANKAAERDERAAERAAEWAAEWANRAAAGQAAEWAELAAEWAQWAAQRANRAAEWAAEWAAGRAERALQLRWWRDNMREERSQ